MTTAGRAEVIEGDYVRGDGTLCGTLAAWSRRVGPVVFQTWQSAFWTIRRNPEIIDEDAEEEEDAAMAFADSGLVMDDEDDIDDDALDDDDEEDGYWRS